MKRIFSITLFLTILVLGVKAQSYAPNTAYPGKEWQAGRTVLKSSDGRYSLEYQQDGNLVLYKSGGQAVWSSKTSGKAPRVLAFQEDGNFVLYGYNGAIWHTRTQGRSVSKLVLQNDGNLVIYDENDNGVWNTDSYERH